jgi:hypothetical protein
MKKKRAGVDAGSAATLIIIIAAVIIMYILFLPPDERQELLENETSSSSGNDNIDENILLDEDVGTLNYFDDDSVEYSIGNVYLYETTNAEVLDTINPFIIQNGWFDKKFKTYSFNIEDLKNTNNVILSLSASKAEGVLSIYLNNEIIYEGQFESLTPSPISLKKSILQEENTLTFEVDGVGMSFWKTNEYHFKQIEIIGDVTDLSGQEAMNSFNIPEKDYQNIDYSTLNFVPYCSNLQEVGKLNIFLNNREIFSAIPICDDSYHQSFSTDYLREGENKIRFITEKGSYSVEQIEIEVDMVETPKAVYYFELNETQIQEIEEEDKEAWLYIEFIDDDENKKAIVNVNGHLRNIDQDEKYWEKNLSDWVEEGNNYIEIEPKKNLHIVNMQITLEE